MKIKLRDKKWVTEDYQKLLWILEHNPRFEKEVTLLRDELKKDSAYLDAGVIKLIDSFDLPQGMVRELKSFIIEDSMPPLFLESGVEKQSLGLTPDVLLQKSSPKGKKREIRITITKKISKTKFMEWVEKNWDSIKFNMETLELPQVKVPRWNDFKLMKKIVELRDERHLSFSDITDELKMNDEDYVKTLYHRCIKWFK